MKYCILGFWIELIVHILFIYSFFLSFNVNLCHIFSGIVQAIIFKHGRHMRMSDCIVKLRLWIIAPILPFFSIFLSFSVFHVISEICFQEESWTKYNYWLWVAVPGIENRADCLKFSLYLSVFLRFQGKNYATGFSRITGIWAGHSISGIS